ncbi:citron Rho-interacting kinase-like [Glandiceps talaboti]
MSSQEAISTRNSKLNQLFLGKAASTGPKTLATRESLLDALFVLYDECTNDHLMRNKHISSFVGKYKTVVQELRQLRLSISDFEVKNVIGRGHFGEVQVVREKSSGDVYAMKTLKKTETLSQENVAFFEEERDIMARAKNPWITSLQYAFQDQKNLYLVMEFHPGGDLLSLLSRYDDIFEESMAKFYMAEMVVAIHNLHTMGYVHRDIKPDNILIDRTGHIKLADFGSAAKLSRTKTVTSQMPVGTPDYVAPEVLTSMNGSLKEGGSYGRECDWWSLGVVAYEMMFAKTPFTGDSIVVTYSNIMNFKKVLEFPADITASKDAKRVIKELCSEHDMRLGYEGLCHHAFFADIDWTVLRQVVPPFVPTLDSVDDTSNFDEFEPEDLPEFDFNYVKSKKEFGGRDLPFIGFTFTKNLANSLIGDRQISMVQDCSSPASKSNLERRLAMKTKELQETQEKFNQLQHQQSSCKNQARKHETSLKDREEELKRVKIERDILERDMALYITEVKNLKRMLELERKEHQNTDNTAVQLLTDIKENNKKAKELKEELQRNELEEYRLAIAQFEQDRFVAARRAERLESELKSQQKECNQAKSQVTELQSMLIKVKDNTKCDVAELQTKLQKMTEDSRKQVEEYKKKLEKALRSSSQATDLLQHARQTKNEMEAELTSLRNQDNNRSQLEEKVQDGEEERKSLRRKVRALEEREVRLNESLETKHHLTQDLSKQILELEDKYEDVEKENRKLKRTIELTEKELDDKVQEYEHRLKVASIKKKTVRFNLGNEHCDKDQDVQIKEKMTEQRNTITMLQANIGVLEKQIEAMISTKNTKLRAERKEHQRATEEKVADLLQEKLYLETQNSNLKCKIKELEDHKDDNVQQVEDVENRLSQTISHYETQLSELRSRLHNSIQSANENDGKLCNLEDTERKLKAKVERLQNELNVSCHKAEEQICRLQDENTALKEKYETLRESCEVITDMEEQLSQLTEQNAELNQLNQEYNTQIDTMRYDVNKKSDEIDKLQDELIENKHTCEAHELNISMLKSTCTMLEEQVLDLEALNDRLEERESSWNDARNGLEKEVQELEVKVQESQHSLSVEKEARLYTEQKSLELAETLEDSNRAHRLESDRLQKQLQDHKEQATLLTQNMNDLEKKHSMLELTVKALQRQYNDERDFNEKLNDEIHKLNSQITSVKSSNFKLTQALEEAIEKGEILKTEKNDLENELENLEVHISHQRIKYEGTISQQTKLIDFLQAKVATPAKKKRMFGGGILHRKQKETAPLPGLPLQYKDLQQNLEREKARRVKLQEQLNKMKVEVQAVKRENIMAKSKHLDIPQTPCSHGVVTAIMMSPSNQPSPSSLLLSPKTYKKAALKDDTSTMHRPKERMKHNIPHRFSSGLTMRATKCVVCMDSVHFGRQASKCHECHQVCHPKCAPLLPHTCGLPSQLMEHFSDAITHSISPAMSNDSTEDSLVALEGWMKVPRAGKQGWDKKWVTLEGTKVCTYEKESSVEPIDEFDLCPSDGKVTVHAAVTPAELFNTASTDLPYILRLEFHPKTTCWPGKNMYFMATSFSDKQKWMANLERMVTNGNENITRATAKMLGNTLIVLEDDQCIDINCTMLMGNQLLLIGAEEGLYSMEVKKRDRISAIGGVDSVFQMQFIEDLGLVLMIAGDERKLCTVDFTHLKTRASQASVTNSSITTKNIDRIQSCHLFAVGCACSSVFICAAMPDKIVLLKYNSSTKVFVVEKEMETTEPCSCIHFTHASVLLGTDKFYELDLKQFTVEEFLDPSDTSLAYAVYGTRHVNSFPVSILQVSTANEALEFLLCFHEFGVFVDEYGRRTRTDDMKWTRLPLAFSYRGPYLYVTHFNSLEVCKIKSDDKIDSNHTFMEIANPRYVGPAITDGAIYVASCHEDMVELLCLQGNTSNLSDTVSQSSFESMSESQSSTSSSFNFKRPLIELSQNQAPLRRSLRLKGSPPECNQASKRRRYDSFSTQV